MLGPQNARLGRARPVRDGREACWHVLAERAREGARPVVRPCHQERSKASKRLTGERDVDARER